MSDKKGVVLERLRELIDSSGKTRDEIAKAIECDTSTITKHYNGNRQVAPEFIIKYAQFFGVSSDYLLGLSNAESTDKDIQFISKYTGLSDKAIDALNCFYKGTVRQYDESSKHDSPMISATKTINRFIERNAIHFLSVHINDYCLYTKLIAEDTKLFYEKTKDYIEPTEEDLELMSDAFDRRDLALFRGQELVKDFMKSLCKEDLNRINEYEENLNKLLYERSQNYTENN